MKKKYSSAEHELVGGPSFERVQREWAGGALPNSSGTGDKEREEFIPNVTYSLLARLENTTGKACQVYLVVHQLCFMRKCKKVKLTTSRLERVGVKPKQKCRALKSLEKAGLIFVERPDGENPMVTLLEG
jgi:hypothetical protein